MRNIATVWHYLFQVRKFYIARSPRVSSQRISQRPANYLHFIWHGKGQRRKLEQGKKTTKKERSPPSVSLLSPSRCKCPLIPLGQFSFYSDPSVSLFNPLIWHNTNSATFTKQAITVPSGQSGNSSQCPKTTRMNQKKAMEQEQMAKIRVTRKKKLKHHFWWYVADQLNAIKLFFLFLPFPLILLPHHLSRDRVFYLKQKSLD